MTSKEDPGFQGPILVYPAPAADRYRLIREIGLRNDVGAALWAKPDDLPERLHYYGAPRDPS